MKKKYLDSDNNEITLEKAKEIQKYTLVSTAKDFVEIQKYEDNELVSIDYEVNNESLINEFDKSSAKIITFFYDKKVNGDFEEKKFKTFIDSKMYSFGEMQSFKNNCL